MSEKVSQARFFTEYKATAHASGFLKSPGPYFHDEFGMFDRSSDPPRLIASFRGALLGPTNLYLSIPDEVQNMIRVMEGLNNGNRKMHKKLGYLHQAFKSIMKGLEDI